MSEKVEVFSEKLLIRLSKKMRKNLYEQALSDGKSVSTYTREAIQEKIQGHPNPQVYAVRPSSEVTPEEIARLIAGGEKLQQNKDA